MIHGAAAIATVFWFLVVGLLWRANPSAEIWLLASLALGAIWFSGFFWYVTRPSKS